MVHIVQSSQTAPVPPQNLDAEEAVLGAMMLSPGAIGAVSEILSKDDFYRESHGKIYLAALRLYTKGEPVDAITLVNELEERRELEAIGGRGRINELAAIVPASANAKHYAKIVRETAILRGLGRVGHQLIEFAESRGESTDQLLARAEELVYELAQERVSGQILQLREALVESFARISELYESGSQVTGLSSGFRDLDRLTAGFQPGNLIIIAARPSMGKSAFALALAAHAAKKEATPCGFFSLEMSRQEVVQRLICAEGRIDSHKIRTGQLAREDWPRLTRACGLLEAVPLYVDDTPGLSMLELRSRAQLLKRREPTLGLIVVDYLQLMTTGEAVESRLQEVSAVSRGLKALAKSLDIPVIALSQLSRAVEQRPDKRPLLSDLRESGTIEQDSDLVMFLYRDEYYHREESEEQGIAEVSLAKHRNGPTDTIKVSFRREYAKFGPLAA